MIPTWVAVGTGISLAILALSAIAIALSSVIAALGVRAFLRVFRELAGPALGDVRQLVTSIRTEADGLVGTSQDLRGRIVRAADAAEARLADLDALFEVVQEEVETTALDVAATLRNVRRGLSLLEWGRRALKPGRKHGGGGGGESAGSPGWGSPWSGSPSSPPWRTPGRRAPTSIWASPCSRTCTSSPPWWPTCCARSPTIFCTATSRPTRRSRRSTRPWDATATRGTWVRRFSTSRPRTRSGPSAGVISRTSRPIPWRTISSSRVSWGSLRPRPAWATATGKPPSR